MLNSLLINKSSEILIESVISNLPNAILLLGSKYSQKPEIAKYVASKILKTNIETLYEPRFTLIQPKNDSIGIDKVRDIKMFTKLKIGGNNKKRVIVILKADKLTIEAQAALLKLVEEPHENMHFIFTAHNVNLLLPTLVSRTQKVQLYPISKNQALEYLSKKGINQQTSIKIYTTSGGNSGLITSEQNIQKRQQSLHFAKSWLSNDTYERLRINTTIVNDNIEDFITSLSLIYELGLNAALSKQKDQKQIKKWYTGLQKIHKIVQELRNRPKNKLLLTHLAIEL